MAAAKANNWRPAATIRAVAIGLIRRDDFILVAEVLDDDGVREGWRPLGGGVEFMESAADALRREIREELQSEVAIEGAPIICENLYNHCGTPGHEIIFAFPVRLLNESVYGKNKFIFFEDSGLPINAEWIALPRFKNGDETLFPRVLVDYLGD